MFYLLTVWMYTDDVLNFPDLYFPCLLSVYIQTEMNGHTFSGALPKICDRHRKFCLDFLAIPNYPPSLPPADGLRTDQARLCSRKTSKPIPTIRHELAREYQHINISAHVHAKMNSINTSSQ